MKNNPGMSPLGQKKIFDVMKPGRAAPSATSRPVIMGHKPKVTDDINGISPRAAAPPDDRPLMDSKSRVTVQPTGTLSGVPVAASPDASAAASSLDGDTPGVAASEDNLPIEQFNSGAELGGIALGSSKTDVPPAAADPRPEDNGQPRPNDHDPAIEAAMKDLESVAAQTAGPSTDSVIVSHHSTGLTFGRLLLALLAVILLAAVTIDILLDIGAITIDAIPHTDFF